MTRLRLIAFSRPPALEAAEREGLLAAEGIEVELVRAPSSDAQFAALRRVHPELEGAASLSGASLAAAHRRVLLPLLLPGLIAAWITIVAVSFRELSATIFLATPQSRFISVVMYSTWADGNTTAAAAIGIVLLLVVLVLALVAYGVGRRFRIAE